MKKQTSTKTSKGGIRETNADFKVLNMIVTKQGVIYLNTKKNG